MLELRTFGGLELRTEAGQRVEALAGHTKCLALLAYLATEAPDGRVPRGEVAALLWPDRTDDRARDSLRTALSRIRQSTGPPVLTGTDTSSVGVDPDHLRADAIRFQEALEAGREARALELYRGDFLAGVQVEDARPFQRWADERRGQLRQRAYGAALSVGVSAREAGELAEAEAAYRRALDLAPFREEAARELIESLVARGRGADAVQLFEAFRERRLEELELAPSDDLEALVEEIKISPPAAPAGAGGEPTAGRAEPPATDGAGTGDEVPAERAGAPEPTSRREDDAGADAPDRRGGLRTLGGVLAVVGLVAVGAWHLLASDGGEAAPRAGDRSVAVLPFEAIGAEEPGPVAAGLHGDLVARLARVPDLQVTSATSVEGFREPGLPLPAIADSLGVTWVVEGEVQQSGDRLRVHAQLIDPATDTHAWSDTYEAELTAEHLFELQGEITRSIAGALETELAGGEDDRLDRPATDSLEAHRFYVRGRSLLEQRTVPDMRRALGYFGEALARDSGYALAWAGRADGLSVLARYPETDPDTLLGPAAQAAERALELDPGLAEAHLALGRLHMYRREGPAALRAMQRAVELKPSYAAAHAWLAKLGLSLGHPEAALGHARRAGDLDPLSRENLGTLSLALLANGRGEEALEVGRRIADLSTESGGFVYRLVALIDLGREEDALALVREHDRAPVDNPVLAGFLAATGTDTAPARKILADHDPSEPSVSGVLLHAALGHRDRAFELLEAYYPRDDVPWDLPFTVSLRYFSPTALGPLRDDPRFDRFLESVHAHWGLEPDGSLPEDVEVAVEPEP